MSSKFEDISLGAHRPSQIVQRYEDLFSQGRMDALDFLEGQDMDTQFCNQFLMEILQVGWAKQVGGAKVGQVDG